MNIRSLVVLFILSSLWSCIAEGETTPSSDSASQLETTSEPVALPRLALLVSPIQEVQSAVHPATCPSGWTVFLKSLSQNEKAIVPLQTMYVQPFFDSLSQYQTALGNALEALDDLKPIVRLPIVWPCWMADTTWRQEMKQIIGMLLDRGVEVEIVLSHHDAGPASLFENLSTRQAFAITNAGWTNDDAQSAFVTFTENVIVELTGILPSGSQVCLMDEPMGMLFNSYLGNGNWPPGGKKAKKSFAIALTHLRDALKDAGDLISKAGWDPLIAQNVRPLVPSAEENEQSESAWRLEYVFNYWLLDTLLYACTDTNFDALDDNAQIPCTRRPRNTTFQRVGITFYGTMHVTEDTHVITLSSGEDIAFSIPAMDFSPDGTRFHTALSMMNARYPDLKMQVSEIGFSSGDTKQQGTWLTWYLDQVRSPTSAENPDANPQRFPIESIGIYGPFEGAQFSSGEWYFHLLTDCADGCSFTPWGIAFTEILHTY